MDLRARPQRAHWHLILESSTQASHSVAFLLKRGGLPGHCQDGYTRQDLRQVKWNIRSYESWKRHLPVLWDALSTTSALFASLVISSVSSRLPWTLVTSWYRCLMASTCLRSRTSTLRASSGWDFANWSSRSPPIYPEAPVLWRKHDVSARASSVE